MVNFKIIFLSVFIMLTGVLNTFSQDTLKVNKQGASNLDLLEIDYLLAEDKTGDKEINQLQFEKVEKSSSGIINLGISTSTFWLKFYIKNESEAKNLLLMIDYPIIDDCAIYIDDGKGKMYSQQVTENLAFKERKYPHQTAIFDLKASRGETFTCYLRIRSSEEILVPLKVGSKDEIYEYLTLKDSIFWFYMGVMVVMFLYNLFLFISVKDKSYLLYIIYILTVTLTQVASQGYGFRFIYPGYPWMAQAFMFLITSFVGLAAIAFVRHFLNLKYINSTLDRVFLVFNIIYILAIILGFIGLRTFSQQVIQVNALLASLYILFIGFYVKRKGYRPAQFFVIAWTVFLLSVVVFVLRNFGIMPYNFFTNYTLLIGSGIEVVLLSFALADRINILKKEKEQSQAEALHMARENERIIREQNIMLEEKVQERTEELQQSNEELNTAVENLKNTQEQLVESEKMASLGQLTAGIAHEINNPINFVTSNITPLKLDIEDLMNLLSKYEKISDNEELKETLEEINSFKEEIDIDYVKDEIASLLKGIDEGAHRTSEIVTGLRNFSRLDEDTQKIANINDCLDSTLTLVRNKMTNKINVNLNLGEIPQTLCYPGKLNQVFMNMINNSIQAIEEKEYNNDEKPYIGISTKSKNDSIDIKIEDNGIGMSEDTKKRVFEPFYTTKEVGKGTGLGMSITYKILQKHQAKITINTELGKGTQFLISIPIEQ